MNEYPKYLPKSAWFREVAKKPKILSIRKGMKLQTTCGHKVYCLSSTISENTWGGYHK